MLTTQWTQFLLPDGRQRATTFAVADDLAPQYAAIQTEGLELQWEVLTTGIVSLTIFDPTEESDCDIELTANRPGVPEAADRLIRRFTLDRYRKWQTEVMQEA